MESGNRKNRGKTQPVVLEPGYDGLSVLARIIARVHLEKAGGKEEDGGTHETRKR